MRELFGKVEMSHILIRVLITELYFSNLIELHCYSQLTVYKLYFSKKWESLLDIDQLMSTIPKHQNTGNHLIITEILFTFNSQCDKLLVSSPLFTFFIDFFSVPFLNPTVNQVYK